MRLIAIAGLLVATFAAAPAAAGATGGTTLPPRSGGTAFGAAVPLPDPHPVADRLRLAPHELVAGDPTPRIVLRVRQRGIERVRARVVVLRLPGLRPVARVELGRVRTGRTVTARLPSKTRLRTGRYLVRLHVKDPRGRVLRRSSRFPGRARIIVRRPPAESPPAVAAPTAPSLPVPTPGLPAPAPSPAGRGVFPVAGSFDLGGPDARFGATRDGHVHEGQDILAAAGTPVVAPYGGRVASASYQESGAGEYIVLDAHDGRDYFLAHCLRGSTVVAQEMVVAAGQQLCRVGATGTTSGAPHLHFEIWVVGWRVAGGAPIDPLPELLAWAPG